MQRSCGAIGLFTLAAAGIIAASCSAATSSEASTGAFAGGSGRAFGTRGQAAAGGEEGEGGIGEGGGRGGGGRGGVGIRLSMADPFGVVGMFIGGGKGASSPDSGGNGGGKSRWKVKFPRRSKWRNKKGVEGGEEEVGGENRAWPSEFRLPARWWEHPWKCTMAHATAAGSVLLDPFGLLTLSVKLRRLLLDVAWQARMSAEPLLAQAQTAVSAVPLLPRLSRSTEAGLAGFMALCSSVPMQDVFSFLLLAFLGAAVYGLVAATYPQVQVHFDQGGDRGRDGGGGGGEETGGGGGEGGGSAGTSIMGGCLSLMHGFRPTPLLLSGHFQTGAVLARKGPTIIYDREMLQTGDGGFISLDWLTRSSDASNPNLPGTQREAQTILLVLHGLTGGSQESYVRSLVAAGAQRGMRAVVMNNRGCAGSSLATPQAYSAAWTADVRVAIRHLRSQHAGAPLLACGFSLGANILAKYVGEEGGKCPLVAAAVVSNPYDILGSNKMMHKGMGPLYDRVLCQGLVRTFAQHKDVFARNKELPGWDRISGSETVLEFDDRHTRRVYGYDSVEHYYRNASSFRNMQAARVPLLSLVAKDDFLIAECQSQSPPKGKWCMTAVTNRGGHVAWYQTLDTVSEQWADTVVLEFLVSALESSRGMPS